MNYFVIMNENNITDKHIEMSAHSSIDETVNLGNGQRQLRVKSRYDGMFCGMIKYNEDEVRSLVKSLRDEDGALICNNVIIDTMEENSRVALTKCDMQCTYPNDYTEVYTHKRNLVTVKVVTVTYTDSDKETLLSVVTV